MGPWNSSGLFLTNNDYIDHLQQSEWFRLHDIKRLSTQIQLIKKYTLEIMAASPAAAAQIQTLVPLVQVLIPLLSAKVSSSEPCIHCELIHHASR